MTAKGDSTPFYDYDAYGNQKNAAANDPNPFRYCGEYHDEETGEIYLRARYYNPATGRFGSEDPARSGLNWYGYCNGNPVAFVDPSGKIGEFAAAGALLGAAIGLATGSMGVGVAVGSTATANVATASTTSSATDSGVGASVAGATAIGPVIEPISNPEYSERLFQRGQPKSVQQTNNLKEIGFYFFMATAAIDGPMPLGDAIGAMIFFLLLVASAYIDGPKVNTNFVEEGLPTQLVEEKGNGLEGVLEDAIPGRKTNGKSKQYEKQGGMEQAEEDFGSLSPSDVQQKESSYGGEILIGTLPDGSTAILREQSSDGRATLEVQLPNGRRIKIRYE